MTTSEEDDAVRLFQNAAGDGSGWDERIVSNDGRTPKVPFLADVDADGDLDIWIGSDDDAYVRLFVQPSAMRPLGPIAAATVGLRAGDDRLVGGAPIELVVSGTGVRDASHALVRIAHAGDATAVQPLLPRAHLATERTLVLELPDELALAGRRLAVDVTLLGPAGALGTSQRYELLVDSTD